MPARPNSTDPGPTADLSARRRRLGAYRWRREGQGGGRRRPRRRAGWALAYLVACGLLFWACLWLRPPSPATLVLLGAGYETNLEVPQDVYGRAGLEGLKDLTRPGPTGGSPRLRLARGPRVVTRRDPWDRALDELPGRALVVVLALQGGVDEAGPYLLPDDAGPAPGPADRVRLEAIIDRLGREPFRGRSVLLVLDAARAGASWPSGTVRNDFAAGLEALNDQIERVPNLVVLSGSGPGERSWASDAWRQSAFVHFLIEGLAGHAGDEDGRIDAAGLFRHVHRRLPAWARSRRGASQHPALLPLGEAGLARAGRIELAAAPSVLPPTAAEPWDRPYAVPAVLSSAWEAFDRLRRESPPPAAYGPMAWSRYLATLVRFEELERAGDPGSALAMATRLAALGREIEQARSLTLGSDQNTLAMPAAGGRPVPEPPEEVRQRLSSLWGAPIEELELRWKEVRSGPGAPGPDDLRTLRAQLADLILRRVADDLVADRVADEDFGAYLGRASALLTMIEDPAVPRPAEVHDLLMIRRDLPATAERSSAHHRALGRAIRSRRLAERTAAGLDPGPSARPLPPYTGEVYPWVRARVERADEERRLGTDLLFSSEPKDWDQAGARLEAAEAIYNEAGAAGRAVRDALAARDEVLPLLPAYGRWAARRPGLGPALDAIEALWDDVHRLARALEADPPDPATILAAPAPTADDPRPVALADLAGRVRSRFDRARRALAESVERALASNGPADWSAIDDALGVPFTDLPAEGLPRLGDPGGKPRLRLLADARRVGVPDPDREAVAPPGEADLGASRQARMALAALGRDWFDARSVGLATFDESRADVASPRPKNLARVADLIGRAWRALPADIEAALATIRAGARADDALAGVRRLDRLTRLVDGAGADALARRPDDRWSIPRKFRARAFLEAQAGRALRDHWAAERDDVRPYYRSAGLAYLDDARRMDGLRLLPPGPIAAMAAGLDDRPDGLRLDGPEAYAWTSERQADFFYRVAPDRPGSPLSGFPVLWAAPAEGLRTTAPTPEARRAFRLGPGPGGLPAFQARLEDPGQDPGPDSGGPARESASSTVRGLFRGQRFGLRTQVEIQRTPDSVASRVPTPAAAFVSVRAEETVFERSGEGRGSVAVVLDASGSMGPPRGGSFGPSTRYAVATRALEGVLKDLPAGVALGVYIFGEAGQGLQDVPAERTIRAVRAPSRWDGSQLAPLMAQLNYPAVRPFNESPIVRTMIVARDDLLRIPGLGPKSIVVITDGDDNRFESDTLRGPDKKDIATFLVEAFKDSGIQINIIAVPLADPALVQRLRGQFRAIQTLPVPGRFYDAGQPVDLTTSLRAVFRRELAYRVVRDDRRAIPGVSAREVPVGRLDAEDIWSPWPLAPGGYRVQVFGGERPREAAVALDGGDLLLLNLADRVGAPPFRRGEFAREFYPGLPFQTDKSFRWRLTALQNQLVGGKALRMLATLERLPEANEGTLRLPRPREAWFELTPGKEVNTPVAARWSNRDGYPAAAYSLSVADWPTIPGTGSPARPTLRAWWREARPAPPSETIVDVRRVDVRLPVDANRVVDFPGGPLTIRGVQVEEHDVEVGQGQTRRMPCLVVRLAYPKGKPAWVSPRGIEPAGFEHRFYHEADSYTGLFWTKTRDEAFAAVDRLEVVGLGSFKALCESEGTYIELPLEAPRPGSAAPPAFPTPPLDEIPSIPTPPVAPPPPPGPPARRAGLP